ncbi:hypothetical protein EYR40_010677 [Pleurotus pulmonarius]|nr:hypothetical protein EYR36_002449 [Pleurotus pulmonarius]KAF4586662.1 hypothetical protein EYR40_010677 [Pleurotus pulmonarius]
MPTWEVIRKVFQLRRKKKTKRRVQSTTKDPEDRELPDNGVPEGTPSASEVDWRRALMPKGEGTYAETPTEETKTSTWTKVLDGVKTTLRFTAEATNGLPVPGLEGAIRGILFIMDNVDRAGQNLADFKRLQRHLEACQFVFRQYESRSLPPAMKEIMVTLISRLDAACNHIKPMVDGGRGQFTRTLASNADASLFQTQVQEINDAFVQFQIATATLNTIQSHESLTNSVLAKLPNVESAYFNSRERKHVTGCFKDTRVDVVKHILGWINRKEASPVFWLHGAAGTGKSTLAQSIAEICAEDNILAGHFFFSRDAQNRVSMDGFFSTLARQMCNFEPLACLVPHVVDALGKCPSPSGMRNLELFSCLFVQPFIQLRRDVPNLHFPMVVVIDALDECQDAAETVEVLQLLLDLNDRIGNPSPPFLKFFITSRPEPHIGKVFGSNKEFSPKFTDYPLRNDFNGVKLYLTEGFAAIRADPDRSELFYNEQTWPKPFDFEDLLTKANGLFIYASTILKFVADEDQDPIRQLKLVMASDSPRSGMYSELDTLYTQIIYQVRDWQRVHTILGTIVLAFQPLSTEQLELLLGLDKGHARLSLRRLHSILVVTANNQDPIRLAHPSFYDFLTTKERSGERYLDPSVLHGKIATACFRIIRDGCLAAWHTSKDASSAQKRLLIYACSFWPSHLSRADPSDMTLVQAMDEFLHLSVRMWFNAILEITDLQACLVFIPRLFDLDILQSHPELLAVLCHETDKFGRQFATVYPQADEIHHLVKFLPHFLNQAIYNFPGNPPHHLIFHHGRAVRRNAFSSGDDVYGMISVLDTVFRSLPHDHEDRGVCLAEMALCHRDISKMDAWAWESPIFEGVIDESEPLLQEALKMMLDNDLNKSVCFNSYGLTLLDRFEAKKDISDLNQAIESFQQSLTLPFPTPALTATFLHNLGSALAKRFEHLRVEEDASAAIVAFEAASNHPFAPPSVAFEASLSLARLLNTSCRVPPLPAYHVAIRKSRRISSDALCNREARRLTKEAIACAVEAFALAIEEGDLWDAIECFDRSCCIFWENGLRLSTPYPSVIEERCRLQTLAVSLERQRKDPLCTLSIDRLEFPEPTEDHIRALIQEYDSLLQSQSNVVKMESKYKQLMEAHPEFRSEGGRIILLCADKSRTFALVLQSEVENVLSIPLLVSPKRLDEMRHENWDHYPMGLDAKVFLQEMWNDIANPIISALGLKHGAPPTRTWWCASVPFRRFPIHAATNYESNPQEHLTDYMISSYTPSLSGLFDVGTRSSTTSRSGLLLLPPSSRYDDIMAVSGTVPREQLTVLPELTDTERVLPQMMACAGIHVPARFFEVREHIVERDEDLSLHRQLLSERSFPGFAYFSTSPLATFHCWDSSAYDLLAAGFSSMIVPWTILSHEDAAAMTSAFYSELIQARGKLDFAFAAHALHAATVRIRNERSRDEPRSDWVGMIHIGF